MGHRNAVDTSEEETQKLINNKPRRNNYALAISILASMTSILLGYGIYMCVCAEFNFG